MACKQPSRMLRTSRGFTVFMQKKRWTRSREGTRSQNLSLKANAIAKHCPLPNRSLRCLLTDHGASEFLPAWTVTTLEHTDRIRAVAAKAGRGRKQTVAAHFDTVFIDDPDVPMDELERRSPRSVTGTRIARVRVIFNLPAQFGSWPHPLAYVEWYTPLRRKDPGTNLYLVSRSTRNGKPNASIISIDRIRRAAHLVPKYGRKISRALTKDNALDVATEFRVNSYISVDLRTVDCS